jgi:Ran GTPase-activating protein (RanGAP) involved in mRNA processing and transport
MNDCKLTGQSGPHLEEMLLNAQTLRHLSLAWNDLGLRAARCIARGLECNVCVVSVQLAWTGLTDVGCSCIIEALSTNTVLQSLDIAANNAAYSTCLVVARMLACNHALATLSMQHSQLSQLGLRTLLKAVKANTARPLQLTLQNSSFVKGPAQAGLHAIDEVSE